MDLNIFIILLLSLIAGGHSLKCYQCVNVTGSCTGVAMTCPTANYTTCMSATSISTLAGVMSTSKLKSCYIPQYCGNVSVNVGVSKSVVSMQCCNTDLCNSQDVPDSSSNSPNGKQCYYCDGKTCSNKLSCLGNEDYCITATATANITSLPPIVKGCASKMICDAASHVPQGYGQISCCQGNLCNSAVSVTQNLVFLLWAFIFCILIH
ncbi:phospholipase A2 inhibitor and Ly6/PLAUR domain-containing protein-like [Misgurnus anguillicaudatus]|uniref:phospholipase A2 inhibitor and Ly6/PLAUR domain-containing protein-like n=1 Tax=Misgurnus anguillicaudatus TaxID=75329 RepID=UPI003CCEFEDB